LGFNFLEVFSVMRTILILVLSVGTISLGVIFSLKHFVVSYGQNVVKKSIEPSFENNETKNREEKERGKKISYSKLSLPILMYHHIRENANSEDKMGNNLSVPLTSFVKQLDDIKNKGYKTITFLDIKKGEIPEKSIILTFDDGYDDFYYYALPELQRRNLKGVLYIVTDFIGKPGYLNKSQILEIKNYGIEIGSHTLSHRNLLNLNKEEADKEIRDSKKYIEDLIGEKVVSFCYPAGKFSPEIEIMVEDVGYDFAVTTISGIAQFYKAFELSRFRVSPSTNELNFLK